MSYLYWMCFSVIFFLIIGLPGLYLFSKKVSFDGLIKYTVILWISITIVYVIVHYLKFS